MRLSLKDLIPEPDKPEIETDYFNHKDHKGHKGQELNVKSLCPSCLCGE
jgi:hypothetical protein